MIASAENGSLVSPGRLVALLTMGGMLLAGSVAFFALRFGEWFYYAVEHMGALGFLGLSGSAAGWLAKRKGYGFWTAFSCGAILPAIMGIAAVLFFLLRDGGGLYCGGAVSLPVALIVLLVVAILPRRAGS